MKSKTEKAIDMALADYQDDMADALTTNAVNAHIAGDMKAFVDLNIPIAKNLVQEEALVHGQKYRVLLKTEGASIIGGKKIPWLAEQTATTRAEVYDVIEKGLKEGKPVASIGGKRAVPGTIAHDLKETLIYDADYKYVRAARSEHARIQNQGALARFGKNNIVKVEVVDGTDFDEACAEANGQIWTVEYATSHELEHPNCTRTFGPVIPDDWMPPEEAEPVKKPKITKKTAPPKPGVKKPATPKTEISEIAEDLTDREIKTSKFGKFSADVDASDVERWAELRNRGWSDKAEIFTKGKLRANDIVHLDKDGNVFAISRYKIKGKTLRIDDIEINPALKGPEYGKTALRDIADDGLANSVTAIDVTAWSDDAKALYNSAGLKQKPVKSEFSADLKIMKELAGKTDLVVTSRTKETARITKYLKKLEKSDPKDLARYKDAVNSYTTERYKIINPALRDGIDSDKVIARMTAKEHAILKRDIDTMSEYLKDAPKFKGEVYRGVGFDDKSQFDDFIRTFQSNTHTTSPQFTSSSIVRSDAEYFKARSDYSATLKIKSNEGSYIGGLSDFREETEVLFNHNTKFKIKNIVKVSDKHYDIELEDVFKPKIKPKAKPSVVKPKVEPKVEPKVKPKAEPKVKPKVEPEAEPFKTIKPETASKDMSAYVKKQYTADPDEWGDVLSEVQFYTEFGFEDINKVLRKGKFGSSEYDDSINVMSKFLKDAPKSRGTVYRGMRFDDAEDFNKFITSIKNSDTTVMKSFTSTSTDIDNIQDFLYQDKYSVVMNIKSTNGVFIDDISATQGELEVLFNHHTKFKINKVTQVSDNRYNIDLEELIT